MALTDILLLIFMPLFLIAGVIFIVLISNGNKLKKEQLAALGTLAGQLKQFHDDNQRAFQQQQQENRRLLESAERQFFETRRELDALLKDQRDFARNSFEELNKAIKTQDERANRQVNDFAEHLHKSLQDLNRTLVENMQL